MKTNRKKATDDIIDQIIAYNKNIDGWHPNELVLSTAYNLHKRNPDMSINDLMSPSFRAKHGFPVSEAEMRDFVKSLRPGGYVH